MAKSEAHPGTGVPQRSAIADQELPDPIFEPLVFRNLTVKNRIFRSSISGRIDNYDGSGTQARVNWEQRFARGGVGGIISARPSGVEHRPQPVPVESGRGGVVADHRPVNGTPGERSSTPSSTPYW
jgi:hypothetical protein